MKGRVFATSCCIHSFFYFCPVVRLRFLIDQQVEKTPNEANRLVEKLQCQWHVFPGQLHHSFCPYTGLIMSTGSIINTSEGKTRLLFWGLWNTSLIQAGTTPYDMVERLLDFLQKGNAETMGHFMSSLEKSNQQHVVEMLVRELKFLLHAWATSNICL